MLPRAETHFFMLPFLAYFDDFALSNHKLINTSVPRRTRRSRLRIAERDRSCLGLGLGKMVPRDPRSGLPSPVRDHPMMQTSHRPVNLYDPASMQLNI